MERESCWPATCIHYSLTKKLCLTFNSKMLKDMEADSEIFLTDEQVFIYPIKYEHTTAQGVSKPVFQTKSGSRSSGMDAVGWRRTFTLKGFRDSSINLCKAFSEVAKKLRCNKKYIRRIFGLAI